MHAFTVGKLYHPERLFWPETAQYIFQGGQHQLLIFLKSPTPEEVQSVGTEQAQFAVYDADSFLVFLYQFGRRIPWSDCPFSIHLIDEEDWELDDPGYDLDPRARASLPIILVNSDTGIIEALRLLSLSPAMSRTLLGMHQRHAKLPWDRAAYDAAVRQLYAKYPSPEDLAKRAAAACIGGAKEDDREQEPFFKA